MNVTTKSAKIFFIETFLYIFIVSVFFSAIVGILITIYQFSTVDRVYQQRLLSSINQQKNEILNEIALNEKTVLVERINNIKDEMNVDKISLIYGNTRLSSLDQPRKDWASSLLSSFLSSVNFLKPLKIKIFSDYGNINAQIIIYYSNAITEWIFIPTALLSLLILILSLIPIIFIFLRLFRKTNMYLINPLTLMTSAWQDNDIKKLKGIDDKLWITEIKLLKESNEKFIEEKLKNVNSLNKMATQVAHDIRSPVAGLVMLTKSITNIDERQRILIGKMTDRINEIANNLLIQYQDANDINRNYAISITESENVTSVFYDIVFENNFECMKKNIQLELNICDDCNLVFIRVNLNSFKRVISNLIRNAVESIEHENGCIVISVNKIDGSVRIKIIDNGVGVSKETLDKILNEGLSFGKKHGFGLGIPYVQQEIKNIGGDFAIKSALHHGTEVTMILPSVEIPNWFAPNLCISRNSTVLIVDDEDFIFETWKQRFDAIVKANDNIKVVKCKSINEMIQFIHNKNQQPITYLIDYEFTNATKTGLDAIATLKLGNDAKLVTNRYNDSFIRQSCMSLGVKLIPKNYVQHISISII